MRDTIHLLIPDYFNDKSYETILQTSSKLKINRFKVNEIKKILFSKEKIEISINGNCSSENILKDVKICIAPNSLSKKGTDYLVNNCPSLEWIHSTSTGVDHLLISEIIKRNIRVTNEHLCSEAMAEYVLTIILCILKRILSHHHLQKQGIWKFLPSQMLTNKKAGILGLGHVGQAIANRLKQNGIEVWGMGRNEHTAPSGIDRYLTWDNLDLILNECDFIIIALPLTDSTYQCINAQTITRVKKDAWLINIGRGELIENNSLIKALDTNTIGGACLDVVDLNLGNKIRSLRKYSNLILTHHSSFYYPGYNDDVLTTFIEELKRYLENQKPLNPVNMNKGY